MSSIKNSSGLVKTAGDLLKTKFLKLSHKTTFENAVMHLGQGAIDEAIIVNENDNLVGIFRARDVAKAMVEKHTKSEPLSQLLSIDTVQITEKSPLADCLSLMLEHGLSQLPITRAERVCGVINLADVLSSLQTEMSDHKVASTGLQQELDVRDDYIGVLSHDLRTPLSVIILCADYLLAEKNRRLLTPDHVSFVERIHKNANSANTMVRDILEVVRKHQDVDLTYQEVDVEDFLTSSIANLQVIADQKKIKLELTCKQPLRVNFDPNRMSHVLENLVNNAVKFSPEGKTVTVEADCDIRHGVNYLVLSVRDEGPGIRPEDEASIFEKFRQASTAGELASQGVGLGLAIVKKFVELHQGFIEVDGGWQQGATFKAYIPGAEPVQGAHTNEPTENDQPDKLSVLLVEDDESIREYFAEELKMEGFHVYSAVNGEDGYNQFLRYKPDIVLSDIKMPVMDGLELLAKIRNANQEVPVILCSGYYPGLAEDLATSSFKANHVIEKPVGVDYVIKVFERCLGEERVSRAS